MLGPFCSVSKQLPFKQIGHRCRDLVFTVVKVGSVEMIGDGAAVIPILAWRFVISTASVEGKAKRAETRPFEKIPSVHVRSYLCIAVVFGVTVIFGRMWWRARVNTTGNGFF